MKKLLLLSLSLALCLTPAAHALATPERAGDVLALKRPAGPEWFGLYLLGKKAGWTRTELSRERRDGRDVVVARSETLLQAALQGKSVQRHQRDEKVYEAHPGGLLLTFLSERDGDGGRRRTEGTCSPVGCRAVLTAEDGPPQTRDLPPTGERLEQADAVRLAAALRTTVHGAQLSVEELRDKRMKDVFQRRARIAGGGVEVPVSLVAESQEDDRMSAVVAVADDGRVLEIRFGEALVAKPEAEETAKRLDRIDLFGLSRVPLPRPLPQAVPARIQFRLRGLPVAFQKADARQTYVPAPGGVTLLTVTARRPRATQPGRGAPRGVPPTAEAKELLEATPEIDSDDPRIRKLAGEVVGDTRDVYGASVKLERFVYGRLKKAYGASHDRASEVLEAGEGDCTEHALLFVALARAAGIPARGVHGLVYTRYQDGVPALYWHAWVEVKSGDEWIALDPTFDEPVADATHIALGRGTQVDTVGLLGAIQVVSAEPKPLR